MNTVISILIMALVTYLIRVLPMILIRREIKSTFINSFLYYLPYVTLSIMFFPDILFATSTIWAGLSALLVALFMAWKGFKLLPVAIGACIVALIFELII